MDLDISTITISKTCSEDALLVRGDLANKESICYSFHYNDASVFQVHILDRTYATSILLNFCIHHITLPHKYYTVVFR